MLRNPDPADWLHWRRTFNAWGYSPLTQITRTNVSQLALVWTRPLGPGIQEGTPLVYRGVMYFPNPSDYVQALDARTGDLKWEYRRSLPSDLGKYFPVPSINRSLGIYGSFIIDTSADDFVYALDASTGTLAWENKILDYTKGAQQTSGPLIANGKILSGRGCEPEGGPEACIITAHDAKTGKELWRTHTIPKPGEPGGDSWGNVPWEERRHVGTWMVPSYDPELNLIYIGTSVTSPAPKYTLGGNDHQYLYHNCTLAIDADTGKIVWYYQHVVDHWDLDHPSSVCWSTPRSRRAATRSSGSIRDFVPARSARSSPASPARQASSTRSIVRRASSSGPHPPCCRPSSPTIDGATGKVTTNPESIFQKKGDVRFVCPTANGGKNWETGAYSPLTNTMFFPLQNTCAELTATLDKPSPDSLYGFTSKPSFPPGTDKVGTVQAISSRPARRRGSTSSAPGRRRWWRRREACCSAAMRTAAFARSIRAPARCCGR
jgi:alcohol dehydrogenase (cytochrome c)